MAKRTRGGLHHLQAEARRWHARAVPPRHDSGIDADPAVRETFTEMVAKRTGRDISALLESGVDLDELAIRMQDLPRVHSVTERIVFRDPDAARGRVLLLPGLYGITQAFGRLARLLPEDRSVIGWNYPIMEPPSRIEIPIERFAATVAKGELAERRRLPVEIFGYCIGGTIAQELGVQLRRAGIEVRQVVTLDSHPGPAARTVSVRTRLVVSAPPIVKAAERVGPLELGLVRTALAQLKALPKHEPTTLDTDLVVLRSGSRLGLGRLESNTWAGLARSVRFHRLEDLGHVEVFRGRHEERLVPYCLAS